MKIGLHIADFTWPGGPPNLAQDLRRVAVAAEDAGFIGSAVMDHVWQIGGSGRQSTRCWRPTPRSGISRRAPRGSSWCRGWRRQSSLTL